jgi:hypothetical protein
VATLHLVASTGRTATSFLAALFDQLPGVAACHEGHRGDDAGPDLLPLINLENFQVYKDATRGPAVVAHKRSADVIAAAAASAGVAVVLDVAYYNAILGEAILAAHPTARMVGIVRDAASFVRSATWLAGEDPMPVGWPALDKPLSNRERFIGMGRLRPTAGEDLAAWPSWSAIERNLWLWRATNARLLAAAERFPDRVTILDFGAFKASPLGFARRVYEALALGGLAGDALDAALAAADAPARARVNERAGGYQIADVEHWTPAQRAMFSSAVSDIETRMRRCKH